MNFRLAIAMIFTSSWLWGQAVTGTLIGSVQDASSSAVGRAEVKLKGLETGIEHSTISDSVGTFQIFYLIPGSYEIEVSAPGFRTYRRQPIRIELGGTARVDIGLEIGASSERIEVRSESTALQADRADLYKNLSSRSVTDIPLPGRNFQQLITTLAGVSPPESLSTSLQNPQGSLAYRVNGQVPGSNNSQLDGADNNDPLIGVTINITPVEAIEQVNVSMNSYTAESGRAGGAVVNVMTKSGTNQLHGSLFEFYQEDNLRARNFFNAKPREKPSSLRNQYGGTIGGPVIKSKIFYFGSWQQIANKRASTTNTSVPVGDWRRGDFSGVPQLNLYDPLTGTRDGLGRTLFAGNQIPQNRIHVVAARLNPLIPTTNTAGFQNNLVANVPSILNGSNWDGRTDYRVNDKTNLFLKYGYARWNALESAALGPVIGEGADSRVRTQTAVANVNRILTPTLLTETRLAFNRYQSNVDGIGADRNLSADLGIANPSPDRLSSRGLARIAIGGMQGIGMPFIYPIISTDNIFNWVSNWTKVAGRHTFKWGYDGRRLRLDRLQATGLNLGPRGLFNFNPGTTALRGGPAIGPFGTIGNSYASFLLGAADQTSRTYLTVTPTNRLWNHFMYLQDTWQVRPNLTLDFGLRYELYTPVVPRYAGGASNYDPATNALLIAGIGQVDMATGVKVDWQNWAPRFGFAWRLGQNSVVRGGYGISYYTGVNGYTGGTLSTQFPVVGNIQIGNQNDFIVDGSLGAIPGIPQIDIPSTGILRPAPNQAFFNIPFDNRLPYVQSFNLTVQREIRAGLTLDASYVGSLGRRISLQRDVNAAPPGTGNAGRPLNILFGRTATTNERSYSMNNNYHSLQTNLMQRFRNGLQLQASYTWSKAMDAGQVTSHTDLRRNYGPTTFDRTHIMNVSHVYELPIGSGRRWIGRGKWGHVVGAWNLNGILRMVSGNPVTITGDATACNCPGNGNFADVVRPVTYAKEIGAGQLWFDRNAFAAPGANRFGNAGRGTVRGPGFAGYDFSAFREIKIKERFRIEFRSEFFNLTNTPRFANPQANVNGATFGQVLNTLANEGERQIQFGLRIQF